jgi:hypothetical protein
MNEQEGVILDSIVYEKVVKSIEGLDQRAANPEQWQFDLFSDCRVIWESESHYHPTTSYVITGFGEELGETTLKIKGGGGGESGGEYEIIPKPNNPAWIRYQRKDGYDGWEEELRTLVVVSPEFKYVKDDGWRGFFEDAYSIIEDLKKKRP